MYVGVILTIKQQGEQIASIPHVCGGDPYYWLLQCSGDLYSPCMWG